MPEITVTDYDGLEIDAESRAVTVTLVDGQPAHDLPTGGTTNQVLAKASDADYDVAWVNDGVGGGGSLVTVDADGTVTVDGSGVELATDAQLAAHEADTTGVHGITDTSALETTSGAQAKADAAEAAAEATAASTLTAHAADTTAVHGIADTAALVVTTDPRLSDARTPTTHTHDDRYYTETEVDTALAGKAAAADLTAHTGNTSNPHGVTKAQVGLANVDNTSDASKPISTATQTALDAKANATDLTAHLNDTTDAHDASAISFAPTGTIAATDVQAAIAEVAAEAGSGGAASDFVGVKVYRSSAYTVPGGQVFAALPWDAEEYDTDGFHDNATNPSRLTIPAGAGGYYAISGIWSPSGASPPTGRMFTRIYKNGVVIPGGMSEGTTGSGAYPSVPAVVDALLVPGDYIELVTWAVNGVALETASSGLWMYRIGT